MIGDNKCELTGHSAIQMARCSRSSTKTLTVELEQTRIHSIIKWSIQEAASIKVQVSSKIHPFILFRENKDWRTAEVPLLAGEQEQPGLLSSARIASSSTNHYFQYRSLPNWILLSKEAGAQCPEWAISTWLRGVAVSCAQTSVCWRGNCSLPPYPALTWIAP